jgi:peptidoglycan/xylan/chitin deacetylase (PgdA/CDA1 family)
MESNLRLYLDILQQHGITPTFPITAKTLSRNPHLIKKFSDAGVEFAVHGYNHIDYTKLSQDAFFQHTQKAVKVFEKHNIPFSGFRFPYLRWGKRLLDIIDNQFFQWESSYCILWDVFRDLRFDEKNLRVYQTVLAQYDYRNSDVYLSLPRFLDNNNMLQIPVSLPDDDLLTDRLGIKDENLLRILRQSYSRGELFTIQLHPERVSFYRKTLKSLIRTANNSNPKIWATSLSGIAEWWNEKQGFWLDINKQRNDEFEIQARCSKRATILLKTEDFKNGGFFNEYIVTNKNKFKIRSPKWPVIGISNNCSPKLIKFLKNEGFIFEKVSDGNNYSVFLNNFETFNEEDEIKVLAKIEMTHLPLIRFWRWPNGCRSALSITGDIDALTCVDFFSRFFYQ